MRIVGTRTVEAYNAELFDAVVKLACLEINHTPGQFVIGLETHYGDQFGKLICVITIGEGDEEGDGYDI